MCFSFHVFTQLLLFVLQSDYVTMADQIRGSRLSFIKRQITEDYASLYYDLLINVIGIYETRNQPLLLTVIIILSVNQPQVVVVLMQVGCHLYAHGRRKIVDLNDVKYILDTRFYYVRQYFHVVRPAAALLLLPLDINASESVNSLQRYEGFLL